MSNQSLADAAEAAAVFLAEHPHLPDVTCLEVVPNRVADTAYVRIQLAQNSGYLVALSEWAAEFSDPSVAVARGRPPYNHVAVNVHGLVPDETEVTIWAHLNDEESDAMWEAAGHRIEVGTSAAVSAHVLDDAASTQERAA